MSELIKEEAKDSAILILENLIQNARKVFASDIHLEPYEENLFRVRFRQDGHLYSIMTLDSSIGQRVSSRIKILSGLNIAEKRLPQDGRFSMQIPSAPNFEMLEVLEILDMRVSTCPTRLGEKIVLRLQNEKERCFLLEELGLDPESLKRLHQALSKSQGMIIVTGPTGSGKTLSLYAAISYLNKTNKNICTVEDPIEMGLLGVNQVQIQPKIGLSFAAVFSAFLRQDPDVLMLGEIRDLETAEIAMKAAHTGHLVLSTLHTNSALETLTRLSGMGIPRYSMSSALSVLIAQRLIRKLCVHCKEIDLVASEHFKKNIFKPRGCEHCHQGFLGRVGCFELIPITEDLKALILSEANILELQAYCDSQGYWNLSKAALEKVFMGETSLSEIAELLNC